MKSNRYITFTIFSLTLLAFVANPASANLKNIIGMNLHDAQHELQKAGWEITHSSLKEKDQRWFNQKLDQCVTLTFSGSKKGHPVKSVQEYPDLAKCYKEVVAGRKMWKNYHDGKAPVHAEKIKKYRAELRGKGLQVSYWVKNISPGRSAEYWYDKHAHTCALITWDTDSENSVDAKPCSAQLGRNPAPKR